VLSAREYEQEMELGHLLVDPFDSASLGPNSLDLRLSDKPMLRFRTNGLVIDTHAPALMDEVPPLTNGAFLILPNVLYLACTKERVKLQGLCGFVVGRSTAARWGVTTEQAGFIDNGWDGPLTLEIQSPHALYLYPGDRICQLVLSYTEDSDFDYSKCGHYRGSRGPVAPVSLAGRGHGNPWG
jgi:deoxycytidine triphosphate deaminase